VKKIYLFALLFAILTGAAVFVFARNLSTAPEVKTLSAVVAAKRIPARSLISADMVEVRQLPAQAVHPFALTDVQLAIGKIANADIEAGEQVLMPKIDERNIDKAGLAFNIPEGMRAISIAVNDAAGVSGYIKPGDRVDIVISLMVKVEEGAAVSKEPRTFLAIQNAEVLLTGTQTLNSDAAAPAHAYEHITIAVTPDDALTLYLAQVSGQITVLLRSPFDTTVVDAPKLELPAPVGKGT
jgi:pilus assembly protein CpaB